MDFDLIVNIIDKLLEIKVVDLDLTIDVLIIPLGPLVQHLDDAQVFKTGTELCLLILILGVEDLLVDQLQDGQCVVFILP